MVADGALHGSGVAKSSQSNSPRKTVEETSSKTTGRLEGIHLENDMFSQSTGERASRTRILDLLGSTQSPDDKSIREENATLQNLRPSTLTKLLNSTQLGIVTSERQVYRHRKRTGDLDKGKRRINFFHYVAWLFTQRHFPTSLRRKRSHQDKGDCDLNVKDVLKLIENASYRCALTGRKLTPETASLDHCIPVSRGGKHAISNAQLLHRDVNRAKGTLTNEEFVELCRDVVKHANRMIAASRLETE